MENTLNLLLNDTQPQWFFIDSDRPQGPLSSKEIALRLRSGAIQMGNHLWKDGFSNWTRIYDITEFQPLLPAEPSLELLEEVRKTQKATKTATPPPVRRPEEQRIWFVYLDNSQYGPFTVGEVLTLVESQRVDANTYVWRKGYPEWKSASAVAELGAALAQQQINSVIEKASTQDKDKRQSPRKPFEAKILLTDGKEVGSAVCRDISIGGMQILMDHVPGKVGSLLKLNMSSHGDIPSFACEGVIARVLEDGRGFSFRFVNLPEAAHAAIEKFIQTT